MPIQLGRSGPDDVSKPADASPPVTAGDIVDPAIWCFFTTELLDCGAELLDCAAESLDCAAGEIIVLKVGGELDLYSLPILQVALDRSLDQHPAHLVVDLARMTFCSVGGLALLTQPGGTVAEKATGYAVSGVPPQIDRIWTLLWEGDLPVHYRSTAAAVTAIRAAE